ncbi:MAG: hypothetical protein CR997_04600 [Acidobacteria bacterium]|nr:MAG: hypothetical protein CR997_04600 [Acidobacteriota bacterium]
MASIKDQHIARLFLLFLCCSGLLLSVFRDHTAVAGLEFLPPCPVRTWTGIPCPGCGMTRACLSLSQGKWQQAWHYNPLAYLLVLLAVLAGVFHRSWSSYWKSLSSATRQFSVVFLLLVALGTWVYRLLMDLIP